MHYWIVQWSNWKKLTSYIMTVRIKKVINAMAGCMTYISLSQNVWTIQLLLLSFFHLRPPTSIENVKIPWEGNWMIQWLLQFLNKMVSFLCQQFNLPFSKGVNFSLRKLSFVRVWTIKWPLGIVLNLFCQ